MSDFRIKLLGLAGLATVFAGMSYGQITACAADTTSNGGAVAAATNPGPTSMRGEGTTELAADIQFNCTSSVAISGIGSVSAFLSAPVTSKLNANDTVATGQLTEATLFLCATAAACNTIGAPTGPFISVTYGVATGQQLLFTGLTFPAATFYGRIANVRVNANAVSLTTTLTTVTEQVLASVNNTSAATTATTVGFVFKSLATPALVANPNGPFTATVTSYTTCAGDPLPAIGNLSKYSFVVPLVEQGQGGFFKLANAATTASPNAALEAGSYQPADGSKAGVASFGTRVQLAFAGISAGMTLYVPTSITSGTLTLQLTNVTAGDVPASTTTGAPTAGVGTFSNLAPESYGASAAYTPTSGAVTVVYEVTGTNKSNIEGADIPVWVVFAANAYTTAQGPITVIEGYAPQAAASSTPATIPSFAPVTAPVLNATMVSLCATNLLFPFVTNLAGFDTGLVLANTSSDPFGTPAAPGTCNLNFYGTGAPTPSTGVAAPGGTQAAGTANAFLLSSVAPGFSGYMIANCGYQFGHGFAYIAYNLSQMNGTTMGYVALVINDRGNVSEALGQ